ncbi:MAG: transglutaminase family protein, partial [Pseudomonadota bacterium]
THRRPRVNDAMNLTVASSFTFDLEHDADALLQFEAAPTPQQRVIQSRTHILGHETMNRIAAEDDIGERIWLHARGRVEVRYKATLDIARAPAPLKGLTALAPHRLPGSAVKFLFDSRYCHGAQFVDFTDAQFGAIPVGGERIAAMRDWVASHIAYVPGASGAGTTAIDTFQSGQGICRDYAHLFVTLARASAIPARYVACYAPGVTPQDFHAVAEVFLADPDRPSEGRWHLVDATGMADLEHAAIIGVGRDAGDVSFLTSFGPMQFVESSVEVTLAPGPCEPGDQGVEPGRPIAA